MVSRGLGAKARGELGSGRGDLRADETISQESAEVSLQCRGRFHTINQCQR